MACAVHPRLGTEWAQEAVLGPVCLVPGDPLAERTATMTLTPGAGGHLTSVAYTWQHPDDGLPGAWHLWTEQRHCSSPDLLGSNMFRCL